MAELINLFWLDNLSCENILRDIVINRLYVMAQKLNTHCFFAALSNSTVIPELIWTDLDGLDQNFLLIVNISFGSRADAKN